MGSPISRRDPKGLTPGDRFPTPEAAAYDALDYINFLSILANVEYAGVIRRDPFTGQYYATKPESGNETSASTQCSASRNDVGLYHAHGAYSIKDPDTGKIVATNNPLLDDFNSDNFSVQDIEIIQLLNSEIGLGFSGYLGTPSGNFLKYTPGVTPESGSPLTPPMRW